MIHWHTNFKKELQQRKKELQKEFGDVTKPQQQFIDEVLGDSEVGEG